MSLEDNQFLLFDPGDGGGSMEVPVRRESAFREKFPNARRLQLFDVGDGGEAMEVPDDRLDAFRAKYPKAERLYLFDEKDGGAAMEVPRAKLGAYIQKKAVPDKDRSWGSYAGEAYADAGRAVAEGARKVAGAVSGAAEVVKDAGKAVGQAVGTVASNAADVARRIPAAAEGFLDRVAVGPALLAGRVADALNPDPLAGPVDVLTGQRGRYSPQEMGYEEDPYRQGLASRTADRARAWLARRDEARAPTTPAGRVADVPVQFGTTLVGYSTPVGPLAMVGNAAAAGDRAYAEGASGAQALGRTALSLGAQAAAFGPKPIPVPGANAAGRAVEGAAARIGGRLAQTPEGAARAVRTAVTAGQVARGAVDSGARMAAVTAAEGGDAKDVLIAAGVGGAVGGALRGLSTRPLARVAGEAAGRMARGGVDTPPPRMDPAGLAANRAEATARTPEGDAALARANAGLASPERAGLPAPAEPGAVPTVYGQRTIVPPYYGPTVSRPGEPITPPAPYADKVPEPIPETREEVVRRRKEALDALPLPQRLKKTGFSAYYDQYPDRGGVLDAIGFEKFAKLYRKYKGDFRNVTGDLVNADEVGGIVGRDYSGADGVRRALEDGAQEYAGFREWKEQGAPTAEEEMQTGQEIAWNRAQNAEAEAEVRRRYELTHPEMTGEPRVTEEEIRAAQAAAEQGEVERIEAEAMQEPEPAPATAPAPAAGSATPPPADRTAMIAGVPVSQTREGMIAELNEIAAKAKKLNAAFDAEADKAGTPEYNQRSADEIADRLEQTLQTFNEKVAAARRRWPDIKVQSVAGTVDLRVKGAPADFALDGGTPAEIDAEKARVAEAQKRAALEEAAAAPGRDLGTVSIQEGLPGIGGDGTLFTPPAGGWSGRVASGPARGDVAAETPRLSGAPEARGVKPATPDGPRAAIRSELQVLLDSGEKDPATLEDLARRAEAADAFATAALARQAAGTYRGTPWGTEGGSWPAEPPPMAKLELGDMVDLARELSANGAVPKVVRRIARVLGGRAAGVFRSEEGVPTSGKVEMLSRFAALVDKGERAAIEDRAQRRAAATGAEPGSEMFREAYDKALADGLGKAVEASLKAGPKPAMAVLAHEIGHWVDFLDEGTLKRGNVLGHIAALKKYGARNLYPSQAAADAAGSPKLTKEEVRARAVEMTDPRESFKTRLDWLKAVSKNESAARAALVAERDMATLPQMREQMERLVAWFRQSDGAPDYFRNDPAELYAEAFSAWMNYPSNARRLAPRFADLMDGWIESHGAAGRAVRRFQTMVAERGAERAAAAATGGTPPVDEAFFERRRKESAAASMAEDPAIRKILSEDKDPIPKWKRNLGAFLNNFVGPRTMLEDLILGAPDAKGNPEALPVFRALQDLDNAGNMGRLWHYRFQTRVMPKLEAAGIPLDDFRDFLKYRRLGWEITGERMEGGAANKFGPGGVSPGYQATGARARVEALRAKYGRALDDAADTFFDDVRMGADAGGEGSILKRLIESPVLSQAQKDALGNRLYVSLSRAMVPDTTREVTSAREMKNWNGIWRLSTGSFQETGDVIANTLLQDATMFPLVMRQEARLRLVDYLREKMPEWVGGPAEMKVVARTDADGNPFTQSVPRQQTRPGWRVVTFNRDGKTEGWWLPDFVAKGLEPQTFAADKTTAERDADAAWAKLSRASNASLTTGNLVFNPVNALARDPNGLSRYALPRRGEGAKGALYNTVGDVSLGLRSLFDKTATNLEKGVYDPRAVHALASGALNDTAAGWGPTGGTGGVAAMAEDIRRQGRSELTEDELRRFWQGFGNRPERVEAALRKEGSKIEKAAGQVERIWNTYAPGRVNQWLGKREMASKAASLADLEARYPDMTPEERNWWVKNMMGTPDLANRPLYDRNPRFRAAAPFWTPFVHGIRYQVMRAFQKIPGTLGRRLAVQMLPKILAVAAPTIGVLMAKRYYEEWKRMKESGRYSAAALDEQLAKAARWTAFGQAYAGIPLRHRIGGFTAPLPGGYYYYQPTDQGLLALESLALGAVGGATKQGSYKEGILGAVNEFLPNVGPIPNTAIGLATTANGRGFDLNMGTPIVGEREQHPALRTAGWAYNNLTGRGLGILPAETIEGWITGTGPTAGEAAKRAWKLPLLSAFPGAFIRKRGSGEWAARAGATRQEQAEESEMRGEATQGAAAALRVQERARKGESDPEADKRDRERTNEAGRRIQELGGDAGARLRSAAERQNLAASDLSPSERLIVEKKGRLSDAAKEWLDPAAHAMLEMPEVWQKLHEKPEE